MIDESILDLQISIFLMFGVLIFFIVYIKTRDLKFYLPGYSFVPVGYFFYYLRVFGESYRLLGNTFLFIGLILFIIGSLVEYNKEKPIKIRIKNVYPVFFITFFFSIVMAIQLIIICLSIISSVILLKLFKIKKTPRHISLFLFQASGALGITCSVLDSLNLSGVWEFSYIVAISYATLFMIVPIITYFEKLLVRSEEKLRELNEIKNELITRISHELKTPTTSIYGATQAFIEIYKKDLNDEMLELVEIVYKGGIRLKNLVETLIDVIMLESKMIELNFVNGNLSELVRNGVMNLSRFADQYDINVILNIPDEIFFNIDNYRLNQAFSNIFSNAINNTLPGGEIEINIEDTNEYIDIKVKDNGVGITDEEKDVLFKKFGKIERYGKGLDVRIEGPGLGLYIAKELVELHGGLILAESEGRNKGSTFIIRLKKEKNRRID